MICPAGDVTPIVHHPWTCADVKIAPGVHTPLQRDDRIVPAVA
jgi:hypothetical protein